MNEIVNADYKVVLERTLPVIISEILTIEKNVCSVALDGAIQIGQRLHEAKAQVEHGEWENWCKQNLNYSHSQATRFMKLATEYGDENSPYSKVATSQDFSISKALELLKVPEEEVEDFAKSNDIESDTVKELREKIKLLTAEKESMEEEKKDAYDTAAKAEAELASLRNAKLEASIQAKEYAKACEELRTQLEEEKSKSRDTADTEEVRKLKEELEETEKKLDEARSEFKTLEESFEQAQKEASDEAARSYERGEAHGKQIAGEAEAQLKNENELLKKKLENSADPAKAKLAVLGNQRQSIFAECMTIIGNMTGEEYTKGVNGMKMIVSNMKARLE